jgi:hypothetical protein
MQNKHPIRYAILPYYIVVTQTQVKGIVAVCLAKVTMNNQNAVCTYQNICAYFDTILRATN